MDIVIVFVKEFSKITISAWQSSVYKKHFYGFRLGKLWELIEYNLVFSLNQNCLTSTLEQSHTCRFNKLAKNGMTGVFGSFLSQMI